MQYLKQHTVSEPTPTTPTTQLSGQPGVDSDVTVSQSYGGHSDRETPGPIPNPEAKPVSADGTAPDRVWESRTPPNTTNRKGTQITGSPFVVSDKCIGVKGNWSGRQPRQ